jgi:hypothetical protein
MPYIKPERRNDLWSGHPETAGELNFLLTREAISYVERHGLSYQSINDVMGVFASAAQEFYRRVAAPYEDEKIAQNGDVY